MFAFSLAVFLLIITPGPGVLSTAGVGAAYGWRPGLFYVAGLCAGTNLVSLAVSSGLAAIILAHPLVRTILLFASAVQPSRYSRARGWIVDGLMNCRWYKTLSATVPQGTSGDH